MYLRPHGQEGKSNPMCVFSLVVIRKSLEKPIPLLGKRSVESLEMKLALSHSVLDCVNAYISRLMAYLDIV